MTQAFFDSSHSWIIPSARWVGVSSLWILIGLGLTVDQDSVIHRLMGKPTSLPPHCRATLPSHPLHSTSIPTAWNATIEESVLEKSLLSPGILLNQNTPEKNGFFHHSYPTLIPVWQMAFLWHNWPQLYESPSYLFGKGRKVSPKKVEGRQTLKLGRKTVPLTPMPWEPAPLLDERLSAQGKDDSRVWLSLEAEVWALFHGEEWVIFLEEQGTFWRQIF